MADKSRYFDLPVNALARAAVKRYGGKQVIYHEHGLSDWNSTVEVPENADRPAFTIYFVNRQYGKQKEKVQASISVTKADPEVRVEFPSAMMSADRGEEAILADFERRILNQADTKKAFDKYKELLAIRLAQRAGVKEHLARILREAPNACVVQHSPPRTHDAQFYSKAIADGTSVSFNARVNSAGNVSFDRMGEVTVDQALRILAILREKV